MIKWIDNCVDNAETVAEVDLFLELKKRLVEREILDRLELMLDVSCVRAELSTLLANLPEWALKLIAYKQELNIRYRGLEFFFKEGRLTTLIVITGKRPVCRIQGVAEMRAMAREAAECFEDALAI